MPEIIRFPRGSDNRASADPHLVAIVKIVLLATLAIGFFIFHVWFRTYALTEGYTVASLRRDLARLESETIEARLRKNRIMGPQSLKRLTDAYRAQGIIFEAPKAQQVYYHKGIEGGEE